MNSLGGRAASTRPWRPAVFRGIGFLVLWLLLFGTDAADHLAVGSVAAAAATWASLLLAPPGAVRPRPAALAALAARFAWRSLVAGVDVAVRALDPRLPLRPGLVVCPLRLAPGPTRQAFRLLSSLQPGTLPVGPDEDGTLRVHCLDTGQPVAAQLAREEAALARALGLDTAHE